MRCPLMLFALCTTALPQANQYNSTYRGEDGDVFSRKPNAFLVEMARQRKPGRALDVGMGQGRNSIFLAQQGWDVTGFDPADVGVRQAKAEADPGFENPCGNYYFRRIRFRRGPLGPHRPDIRANEGDCAKGGTRFETWRSSHRGG